MIRQFTLIPALLGIAALIISACSAGGGGTENSGIESAGNGGSENQVSEGFVIIDNLTADNPILDSAVPAKTVASVDNESSGITVLEGTWVSCTPTFNPEQLTEEEREENSDIVYPYSSRQIWTFSGNNFTKISVKDDEAYDCTGSYTTTSSSSGTFTIEDGVVIDGNQLTKVNILETITLTENNDLFKSGDVLEYFMEVYLDNSTMYFSNGIRMGSFDKDGKFTIQHRPADKICYLGKNSTDVFCQERVSPGYPAVKQETTP
jgi:hypothetical protein